MDAAALYLLVKGVADLTQSQWLGILAQFWILFPKSLKPLHKYHTNTELLKMKEQKKSVNSLNKVRPEVKAKTMAITGTTKGSNADSNQCCQGSVGVPKDSILFAWEITFLVFSYTKPDWLMQKQHSSFKYKQFPPCQYKQVPPSKAL